MLRIAISLIFVSLIYFQAVKPLVSDHYQAKKEWVKALAWQPDDSTLHFKTGNLIRAIETNNGDLTQYSLWCNLAIRLAQQGARDAAKRATEKALWYYPDFEAAKKVLEALNK